MSTKRVIFHILGGYFQNVNMAAKISGNSKFSCIGILKAFVDAHSSSDFNLAILFSRTSFRSESPGVEHR